MDMRYERNLNSISCEEQLKLKSFKICIAGLGGLGGYIAQELLRMGANNLTLIDGDVFNESNLNRQIFSNENNLGKSKVYETKNMLLQIDKNACITAINEYLTQSNFQKLLAGFDLVFDGLDNIKSRLLLEKTLHKLNTPFIHGAVSGFCGQVITVLPGSNVLSKLYANLEETTNKSVLAFAPAVVASLQVCEGLKLLLNKGELLKESMLFMDFLSNSFEVIEL